MDKYYLITGDGAPYVQQYRRSEAEAIFGAHVVAELATGKAVRMGGAVWVDMVATATRAAKEA